MIVLETERLLLRRWKGSDREPFHHPNLPEGRPLRRHVLYRLRRGTAE